MGMVDEIEVKFAGSPEQKTRFSVGYYTTRHLLVEDMASHPSGSEFVPYLQAHF
jgi:hypothetical protein